MAKNRSSQKTSDKNANRVRPIKKVAASPKRKKSTAPKSTKPGKAPFKELSKGHFLNAYGEMLRARLSDQKIIILYKQTKCHFQIGCAGHEAIQVAAGQVFRPGKDWFYPYYRDMALMCALGMSTEDLMLNAMNREADPNSHGRQMPMHYGDSALRVVSQSSPTGTQFNQAAGAALGIKLKKRDAVVYVSAGEGACAQGDFHESINWAARDKLPIVFVVENNGYAISVPVSEQLAGESVYELTAGYEKIARFKVDGTDFVASFKVMKQAHALARAGKGPCLVEAFVPRLQSHSISDNQLKYRSEKEIQKDMKRCPIASMKRLLLRKRFATRGALGKIEAQIQESVDQAAEWAESQPECDTSLATEYTYSGKIIPHEEEIPSGPETYMVDALNHALDEELAANPDMFVFGQDVAGGKGGVFSVTANLTAKHGRNRVFNSQLAESSIAGFAVGMATIGLKPVAEIQFGDYVWTAMMQLRNELAMLHYRSRGDFSCPAVIRIPVGGYIHGGPYHSQNIEATFSHFPGLYVLYPSNATDAKGLLKSAIRCNNPVLFLEHKGLYRQVYTRGPEGDENFLTPIGKAKVVREGTDLTIVTWGALVQKSLHAAQILMEEDLSVEVIDIRSIAPLDMETIAASLAKTNRVLIAHEDTSFMGFGAEIAAQLAEDHFHLLDAPVKRVTMKHAAAVPHSPALENVILPQNEDIIQSALELVGY